jgi:hypothetical protein
VITCTFLGGYWSVLTSPGCPVGDDISRVLAEISYFARRIRQAKPRRFNRSHHTDLKATAAGQEGSVVRRGAARIPAPHDLQARAKRARQFAPPVIEYPVRDYAGGLNILPAAVHSHQRAHQTARSPARVRRKGWCVLGSLSDCA